MNWRIGSFFGRMHRDRSGAVGVLAAILLMTIIAIVALGTEIVLLLAIARQMQ
jgi:Flp pilus assembly protein TadG